MRLIFLSDQSRCHGLNAVNILRQFHARVRINHINRYKQYCINCLATYQIWYANTGVIFAMILTANFFRQDSGNEPVRDWLNEQEIETKKDIGSDIRTIQNRWPLGMPLVRKISTDLWEVRTNLKIGIARVFFTISQLPRPKGRSLERSDSQELG